MILIVVVGLYSAMDNMRLAQEIEERQRYQALKMKLSSKETTKPQTESIDVEKNVETKAKKSQQL